MGSSKRSNAPSRPSAWECSGTRKTSGERVSSAGSSRRLWMQRGKEQTGGQKFRRNKSNAPDLLFASCRFSNDRASERRRVARKNDVELRVAQAARDDF